MGPVFAGRSANVGARITWRAPHCAVSDCRGSALRLPPPPPTPPPPLRLAFWEVLACRSSCVRNTIIINARVRASVCASETAFGASVCACWLCECVSARAAFIVLNDVLNPRTLVFRRRPTVVDRWPPVACVFPAFVAPHKRPVSSSPSFLALPPSFCSGYSVRRPGTLVFPVPPAASAAFFLAVAGCSIRVSDHRQAVAPSHDRRPPGRPPRDDMSKKKDHLDKKNPWAWADHTHPDCIDQDHVLKAYRVNLARCKPLACRWVTLFVFRYRIRTVELSMVLLFVVAFQCRLKFQWGRPFKRNFNFIPHLRNSYVPHSPIWFYFDLVADNRPIW